MQMNSQLKWHINYASNYTIRSYLNCVKWTFHDNLTGKKIVSRICFYSFAFLSHWFNFLLTHGAENLNQYFWIYEAINCDVWLDDFCWVVAVFLTVLTAGNATLIWIAWNSDMFHYKTKKRWNKSNEIRLQSINKNFIWHRGRVKRDRVIKVDFTNEKLLDIYILTGLI